MPNSYRERIRGAGNYKGRVQPRTWGQWNRGLDRRSWVVGKLSKNIRLFGAKTLLENLAAKLTFWASIIKPVRNLQCLSENHNFLTRLLFTHVYAAAWGLYTEDLGHRKWAELKIWSWGQGPGHAGSNMFCVGQMTTLFSCCVHQKDLTSSRCRAPVQRIRWQSPFEATCKTLLAFGR